MDAVSTGAEPGTLHRFDATAEPLPAELFRSSTHALGVADAVELARELDRLPARLAVYGIEGENFETGEGLTPAVEDDRRRAGRRALPRAAGGPPLMHELAVVQAIVSAAERHAEGRPLVVESIDVSEPATSRSPARGGAAARSSP